MRLMNFGYFAKFLGYRNVEQSCVYTILQNCIIENQ